MDAGHAGSNMLTTGIRTPHIVTLQQAQSI